jgi:hypothetical protein
MRQGLTGIALLGLVLAGCGGGDGESEPPEQTGVMHSRIQGVSYRTPTRSGKTDANGNFKYLAGETVTFSVSGIELGSAPGSSNISLFTLAGMTAPTSELALRRELNRLRYTATPLSNAANRAWLLLALDSDGNPGNGIDVSAHESALASARISFDARFYDFPAKASRLAPGMNTNIPYSFPTTWLYRSLGMAIAANAPTLQLDDLDGDGVNESRMTVEVDSAGDIVTTIVEQVVPGQPDRRISFVRDAMGRITRRRELQDMNQDGEVDRDHTTINTYDVHGNLTRAVEWEDADADGGLDSEQIGMSTFDTYGRLLQTIYTLDYDYDGHLDSRETHTYTRDGRGNPVRLLTEVDLEADGSINGRYVSDSTWDASDRQLTSGYDRDFEADGHVDSSRRATSTYGASEQPATFTEQYDGDGDGVYEQVLHADYSYDGAGNLSRFVGNYESHYDGWDDAYRYMVEMTYDRDQRPLTRTLSYDFENDGTMNIRDVETNTYDTQGFLLSWVYVSSFFGNGNDWMDRVDYTYTPEGAQSKYVQGTDFDGDGTLDVFGQSEIQYAPANNALPQIVTQYLGL